MVKPGLDYWIAINSCNQGEVHEGIDPLCVEYEECDPDYPVLYCEHSGGHEWTDFGGDAIWNFFQSLSLAVPSDETGSGNIDDIGEEKTSFKIHYSSDFVGTPEKLALAFYLPDVELPISVAPTFILNSDVPLGEVVKGEVTEYNNVEINLSGEDYGDYMLTVTVYVEGGNYPIPTNGIDYLGLQIITIDSSTIIIEAPLEIEPIEMGF